MRLELLSYCDSKAPIFYGNPSRIYEWVRNTAHSTYSTYTTSAHGLFGIFLSLYGLGFVVKISTSSLVWRLLFHHFFTQNVEKHVWKCKSLQTRVLQHVTTNKHWKFIHQLCLSLSTVIDIFIINYGVRHWEEWEAECGSFFGLDIMRRWMWVIIPSCENVQKWKKTVKWKLPILTL